MNSIDPRPMRTAVEPHPRLAEGLQIREGNAEPIVAQYLRILLKWRWLILGTIATAILIGIIVTLLVTRMYTASVTLEISREGSNIVDIQGVEAETGSLDQEFYQTQYGLLQSRSLAERVAKELNLGGNAGFFEMYGETPLPDSDQAESLRKAAGILLDHISVSPVRASRLVTVSYESPDPELSAKVANAWAENFIEANIQRRFEATAYARQFLEDRLEQVRKRLDESERRLVAYAANNRIITFGPVTGDNEESRSGERSIVTDNLVSLNRELAEARGDRIAAQSRYHELGGRGASPESLTNPAIASLRQKRAEVAAEYAKLLSQFEPSYPPAQALAAQVEELGESIAREEARVAESIENQYQQAVARETALASRVEQLKSGVLDQRRRGIQYNIFQRDVDTNRELYDGLLQRYKEIGVTGGVGANNVSIVDQALPPIEPSQPRPLINLVLSLLIGSALGAALAFAFEQVDEAISGPDELENAIKIPSLGVVPKLTGDDPMDALQDRRTAISEAYLSVETSLKFSTPEGLPRSLVITSTRPAEGKSTSSVALAMSLARLGNSTLLIDADMRSPSLHEYLHADNRHGLSDILSGNASLEDTIRPTAQQQLSLLTAGPTPPNAAELLSGSHLDEVIRNAMKIYDNVVFDAPPVMGLADAPLIASKVAGVVLVVESNGTRARQVQMALNRLHNARANVLGAILTKFETKRAQFGYGYDYGYGYGGKAAEEAQAAESAGR